MRPPIDRVLRLTQVIVRGEQAGDEGDEREDEGSDVERFDGCVVGCITSKSNNNHNIREMPLNEGK